MNWTSINERTEELQRRATQVRRRSRNLWRRLALLGAVFTSVGPSLQSLGTIARLEPTRPQEFVEAGREYSVHGSFMVVTKGAAGFTVMATAGHDPAVGAVISGDRQQLARRALTAKGLVSALVRDSGAVRLAR